MRAVRRERPEPHWGPDAYAHAHAPGSGASGAIATWLARAGRACFARPLREEDEMRVHCVLGGGPIL